MTDSNRPRELGSYKKYNRARELRRARADSMRYTKGHGQGRCRFLTGAELDEWYATINRHMNKLRPTLSLKAARDETHTSNPRARPLGVGATRGRVPGASRVVPPAGAPEKMAERAGAPVRVHPDR